RQERDQEDHHPGRRNLGHEDEQGEAGRGADREGAGHPDLDVRPALRRPRPRRRRRTAPVLGAVRSHREPRADFSGPTVVRTTPHDRTGPPAIMTLSRATLLPALRPADWETRHGLSDDGFCDTVATISLS